MADNAVLRDMVRRCLVLQVLSFSLSGGKVLVMVGEDKASFVAGMVPQAHMG